MASIFPVEESSSEEEISEKRAEAAKEAENNKLAEGDLPQHTILSKCQYFYCIIEIIEV